MAEGRRRAKFAYTYIYSGLRKYTKFQESELIVVSR